jgi:hypothetical protein
MRMNRSRFRGEKERFATTEVLPTTLRSAFVILCAAVAIGAGLAIQYLRGAGARRPPWPIALVHGVLGAAGLAIFLAVLQRGLPTSAAGTAGFGPAAAALIGLALLLGLVIARAARRRPPGILVAIHASVAIAGFVVLWTLVSFG